MKNILLMALLLPLLTAGAHAEKCYQFDPGSLELKWTAFKTPHKIGVTGHFRGIRSAVKAQGKTVIAALKKAAISLIPDAAGVDTGDKSRDRKIANFFFRKQKIEAKVDKVVAGNNTAVISVRMFGERWVPVHMNYKQDGNTVTARGHLDIFDFGGGKRLKALNKACYAKHEGKTWSDVSLEVKATLKSCG